MDQQDRGEQPGVASEATSDLGSDVDASFSVGDHTELSQAEHADAQTLYDQVQAGLFSRLSGWLINYGIFHTAQNREVRNAIASWWIASGYNNFFRNHFSNGNLELNAGIYHFVKQHISQEPGKPESFELDKFLTTVLLQMLGFTDFEDFMRRTKDKIMSFMPPIDSVRYVAHDRATGTATHDGINGASAQSAAE